MMDYPKRPPMFAMKAIRLMVKTCLAQRIGADGVMLLTVIVSTEDAAHYRRPVDFWNEQLAPLCGFSLSKMRRIREKCVESGWLVYIPGSKSRAAQYWVAIPEYAQDLDDAPTDEGHDREQHETFLRADEQECEQEYFGRKRSCAPVSRNPAGIRQECEQESGRNVRNILPVPDPTPDPPSPNGDGHSPQVNITLFQDFPTVESEAARAVGPSKLAGSLTAHQAVVQAWNMLPAPFPRVKSLTARRRKALRSRLSNPDWRSNWEAALRQVPDSAFLRGENDRGWIADFDWFCRPDTAFKILEGRYQSGPGHGRNGTSKTSAGEHNRAAFDEVFGIDTR